VHLRGAFNQLRKLKKMALAKGQYLKVLLSLGGFSLSDDFEAATDTDEKRKNLAKNCVDMLIRGTAPILDHDPTKPGDQLKFMTDTARQELTEVFDGIDIDWEFPTQRHCSDTLGQADPNCGGTLNVDLLVAGDCVDKPNFTKLLEEFRAQLGPNRLLAVAIGNTPIHLNFYDLAGMAKPGLLDFIDLFGYDNFGGFSEKTAHQGALLAGRGAPGRPETDFFLNIQDSVVRLMELGVPPGLINVGIPLYGRGVQWTAGHMLPPSFDSDGLDAPLEHPLLLKPGVAGTDFELYRAARGMFDQSDRATGHISSKGKVVHKGEVLTYHFDYGFWPNSGVEDYNDLVKERDRMNADHLDKSGPGAGVQKLKHFYDPAVGAAWLFGLYNTRNEVNQLLDGDPANDDHLQITGPNAGPARWQFWSVEDLDTVKQKVDWVKKNNLGGAFVFELSQDYRTRVDLTAGATGDPRDGELTKQMVKGLQ
jgi:GH18 family chitinase